MASVYKVLALGQTGAEETVLQWARDNSIETGRSSLLPNTSQTFTPARQTGRAIACQTAGLLENVMQSDGTLLLTLKSFLGPEQSKAMEFLGANKKPFLHLWSSVPQSGRLARHFLEMREIKTLNVVGSATESGNALETFIWSVFESIPIPAKV